MTEIRETRFKGTGLQLRAIRERLQKTLEIMSRETNISPSYLSDFERGFKLPTSKYLKHLHDHHNVNLNFIFCSDGRMFRPSKEEAAIYHFGKYQEEMEEMLHLVTKVPSVMYAILGFFLEYRIRNKDFIEEYLSTKEKEAGAPAGTQ
jgi:transcriptional regulator with XRE-family HTH domain